MRGDPTPLERCCRRALDPLLAPLGLERGPASVAGWETTLDYRSELLAVIVTQEVEGPPGVALVSRLPNQSRRVFAVEALLRDRGHDHRRPELARWKDGDVQAELAQLGQLMVTHLADMLSTGVIALASPRRPTPNRSSRAAKGR